MKHEEVIRILREQQKELVEHYQIAYLSIFGAVVRGETGSNKKIGVLVKFARPTRFLQILDLKKHLETLLGCKVEIGKPQSLRPEVKTLILQEAIRVF
jgi:predicted nucleotidyltransferase